MEPNDEPLILLTIRYCSRKYGKNFWDKIEGYISEEELTYENYKELVDNSAETYHDLLNYSNDANFEE